MGQHQKCGFAWKPIIWRIPPPRKLKMKEIESRGGWGGGRGTGASLAPNFESANDKWQVCVCFGETGTKV